MMASIYQLKPKFQGLLRPMVNRLAAMGITPNQITLAAIGLSILGGALIALFPDRRWPFLAMPAILFLRLVLNAADGLLAREHAMQSKLGTVLNELGDVVSDTALYLPFALVPGVSSELMIGIVILAILSEMVGVIGIQVGGVRRYDGPLGKSDRAFIFGALALLFGLGVRAGIWTSIVLVATMFLLMLTIYNRARSAHQEIPPHV
jgi:CDP-diacylglycerol--glycerol-3-phosphate 3-phosphatidyltransferase